MRLEERIQKLIAAAGLCSRRCAEEWIIAGRVTVNGVTARLGDRADDARDLLCVDGTPVERVCEKTYIMLHKPRGCMTTLSDERGRPTVARLVRDCGARVFPVGRLDFQSEGLLLLTNDGDWAQRILHPRHEIEKEYEVTVSGALDGAAQRLAALRRIDEDTIRPAQVRLLCSGQTQMRLSIVIHEGRNRQIRRMCAAVGLRVHRLCRVREHQLLLGDLKPGKWRVLSAEEVAAFDAE